MPKRKAVNFPLEATTEDVSDVYHCHGKFSIGQGFLEYEAPAGRRIVGHRPEYWKDNGSHSNKWVPSLSSGYGKVVQESERKLTYMFRKYDVGRSGFLGRIVVDTVEGPIAEDDPMTYTGSAGGGSSGWTLGPPPFDDQRRSSDQDNCEEAETPQLPVPPDEETVKKAAEAKAKQEAEAKAKKEAEDKANKEAPLKFFLSLRFDDETFKLAEQVKHSLQKRGHYVFLCNPSSGQNFGKMIQTELFTCNRMVCFVTDTYGEKTAATFSTHDELAYANENYREEQGKQVIALNLSRRWVTKKEWPPLTHLGTDEEKGIMKWAFPNSKDYTVAIDKASSRFLPSEEIVRQICGEFR
mmetsp:Transcript_106267/g.298916  ORF Transcript_106267/g.298916 Transcript_106267/m.298916 type:complete len:353 (-) Transcript_106267:79-1137(-)